MKNRKAKSEVEDEGVGLRARQFIVTSSPFNVETFSERRRLDVGPGLAMVALASQLEAEVVQPLAASERRSDRLGALVAGQPQHWAAARALVPRLRAGDLVYATGDDSGLPIGLVLALARKRVKIAVFYTAPDRKRARLLTKMIATLGVDLLPVTGTAEKVETLDSLGLSQRAVLASEQTDIGFFRPGSATANSTERPLIASCGLEQRDYRTLAGAAVGLDVDVKVCAASPNFTDSTVVAMPEQVPDNMEIRSFEFNELRALYQTAVVTVVPLLDNGYSAGMTAMMEAIACGSPVIITETPGLAVDFAARDLVIGVPPGDEEAMKQAIQKIIDEPEAARERAERARAFVLAHHSSERYVDLLCGDLQVFQAS